MYVLVPFFVDIKQGNAMNDTSKPSNNNATETKLALWKGMALLFFAALVLTQIFDIRLRSRVEFLDSLVSNSRTKEIQLSPGGTTAFTVDPVAISQEVLPAEGVTLPIAWGNLGEQMIADGVIDEAKLRALFPNGLSEREEAMLTNSVDTPIYLNEENSRFVLDMLWAFGLANKNEILEQGEMTDPAYGGDASKFASTGGWSLARGKGFDHYSKHAYVVLNDEQQALVDRVSRGIYRPCCGNSTHFPDCNHGMAMLGLLELMAKNGATEAEMYRVALQVNSYWFPQTYTDLATYFKEQGQEWNEVDPQIVLSKEYSSAQGYQQIRQQIKSLPKPQQGGGGCSV